MNKMTKEELIEYFIGQLGDNRVLGEFFSIEEIRKRLNQNIKGVEYSKKKGNVRGAFCANTNIIQIDSEISSPEVLKEIIIHEMLHALSFSEYQDEYSKVRKVRILCCRRERKWCL